MMARLESRRPSIWRCPELLVGLLSGKRRASIVVSGDSAVLLASGFIFGCWERQIGRSLLLPVFIVERSLLDSLRSPDSTARRARTFRSPRGRSSHQLIHPV